MHGFHHWRGGALACGAAATFAAGVGVVGLSAAPGLPSPEQTIGKKVPEIRLKDTAGKSRTLGDFKDRKALVLVFTGTQCPIANGYAEPLSRLAEKYGSRGVQFLAVNANPDESLKTVAAHAKEYRYAFPVLKDERQELANALGARVTPETFVLDAGRTVVYRGRVDDSYASRTEKRARVSSNDLADALDAVLAGQPVKKAVTTAFGCTIVRPQVSASAAGVSYYKDVAPILQESCQSCHRPGQVAPFSLVTYADAKSWATEIKAFTANRQMPPWQAEPGHGDFMDVRRLTDEQVATLAKWADAGGPEGNPKDAPAPKEYASDWALGKPDLVLPMPEPFSVEATGDDVFHCFVLPTNLLEDRQVSAIEFRPGNARVLHHVLAFIDTRGQARALDEKSPGPGYTTGPGGIGFFPSGALGGWAPGNLPRFSPPGVGRLLPKGSDVVIQVHYHKTGKPETDQTSLGLYFAKEPVKQQLRTWALTNLFIDIPPGADNHPIRATMRVPADVQVMTITPHMHLLGKDMKVTATLPDGTVKNMVYVKNWDYRWQDSYRYREPVRLPKGSTLEMVAHFDNSTNNPRNPNNPPKRVTFGEQTTDEMCFAFFEFVVEGEQPGKGNPLNLLGGLFGSR